MQKPILPEAPAVATWPALRDPIQFAKDLWNCREAMTAAFARKGLHYPMLTSGEMNDLLLYLDNTVGRNRQPQFQLSPSDVGRKEFQSLQCGSCHQGKHSLENRAEPISMADIQSAMWDHVMTTLPTRPAVNYEQMAGLVGYLWSLEPRGDPRRGEATFKTKGCAACHDSGKGAPSLNGRDLSPVSLVASLASHGPAMRAQMNAKNMAWPRLSKSELADIAAYLQARHSPAPKGA
jgi:mono/diheme cytochrome c family protein